MHTRAVQSEYMCFERATVHDDDRAVHYEHPRAGLLQPCSHGASPVKKPAVANMPPNKIAGEKNMWRQMYSTHPQNHPCVALSRAAAHLHRRSCAEQTSSYLPNSERLIIMALGSKAGNAQEGGGTHSLLESNPPVLSQTLL